MTTTARDIIERALSVIEESDGADEHAELIGELRGLLAARFDVAVSTEPLDDLYDSEPLPDPIPVGLRFVTTDDHHWSGPGKGRKRVTGVETVTSRCRVTAVTSGSIEYATEYILDVENPMPGGVFADDSWKQNRTRPAAQFPSGGMTVAYLKDRIAKDEIQVIRLGDGDLCDLVAAKLLAIPGFEGAQSYNSGGGCYVVTVPEPSLPHAEWLFGLASDMWGGGLMDSEEGSTYEGAEDGDELCTEVSTDCQDEQVIATALAAAITAWRTTQQR